MGSFRPGAGNQHLHWYFNFTGCIVETALKSLRLSCGSELTRARTERPHGALLQFGTGVRQCMYRIGGRLRTWNASFRGAIVGIPPLCCWASNQRPLSGRGTMPDGEFDWGGRLRKGIGGAQRFPQNGWKPFEECKDRRELDCETDGSSR